MKVRLYSLVLLTSFAVLPVCAQNWEKEGDEHGSISAIAVVTPFESYIGTHGSGVFASTDGGDTWQPRTNGLDGYDIQALATVPGTFAPNTGIFAATDAGVFRSTNAGASWQNFNYNDPPANTDLGMWNWSVTSIVVVSQNGGLTQDILVGTWFTGVFRRRILPGLGNWELLNCGFSTNGTCGQTASCDVISLAHDPLSASPIVFAGTFHDPDCPEPNGDSVVVGGNIFSINLANVDSACAAPKWSPRFTNRTCNPTACPSCPNAPVSALATNDGEVLAGTYGNWVFEGDDGAGGAITFARACNSMNPSGAVLSMAFLPPDSSWAGPPHEGRLITAEPDGVYITELTNLAGYNDCTVGFTKVRSLAFDGETSVTAFLPPQPTAEKKAVFLGTPRRGIFKIDALCPQALGAASACPLAPAPAAEPPAPLQDFNVEAIAFSPAYGQNGLATDCSQAMDTTTFVASSTFGLTKSLALDSFVAVNGFVDRWTQARTIVPDRDYAEFGRVNGPKNKRIWAGTWTHGVLRSDDGGLNWRDSNGLSDGPWQANRTYPINERVVPTQGNGLQYIAIDPGMSGSVEPIWPTTPGLTVQESSPDPILWLALDLQHLPDRPVILDLIQTPDGMLIASVAGAGLYYSSTNGDYWLPLAEQLPPEVPSGRHRDVLKIAVGPYFSFFGTSDKTIVVGADDGVWFNFGAGETGWPWTARGSIGDYGPVTALALSPVFDGRVTACSSSAQCFDNIFGGPPGAVSLFDGCVQQSLYAANAKDLWFSSNTGLDWYSAGLGTISAAHAKTGVAVAWDWDSSGITIATTDEGGIYIHGTPGDPKAGICAGAKSWSRFEAYKLGEFVVPSNANGFQYELIADAGGSSQGSVEPTWPTTPGATVVDGDLTWRAIQAWTEVSDRLGNPTDPSDLRIRTLAIPPSFGYPVGNPKVLLGAVGAGAFVGQYPFDLPFPGCGGDVWCRQSNFTTVPPDVQAIDVSPSDPSLVNVGTKRFGLMNSFDGGETFNPMSLGMVDGSGCPVENLVAVASSQDLGSGRYILAAGAASRGLWVTNGEIYSEPPLWQQAETAGGAPNPIDAGSIFELQHVASGAGGSKFLASSDDPTFKALESEDLGSLPSGVVPRWTAMDPGSLPPNGLTGIYAAGGANPGAADKDGNGTHGVILSQVWGASATSPPQSIAAGKERRAPPSYGVDSGTNGVYSYRAGAWVNKSGTGSTGLPTAEDFYAVSAARDVVVSPPPDSNVSTNLLAGSEGGAYLSPDDGTTWVRLGQGLPCGAQEGARDVRAFAKSVASSGPGGGQENGVLMAVFSHTIACKADSNNDGFGDGGIYWSDTGGYSWVDITGNLSYSQITDLANSNPPPGVPGTLYGSFDGESVQSLVFNNYSGPPTTYFTTRVCGGSGREVKFYDRTAGRGLSDTTAWNFGGAGTCVTPVSGCESVRNPVFAYAASGSYEVTLTTTRGVTNYPYTESVRVPQAPFVLITSVTKSGGNLILDWSTSLAYHWPIAKLQIFGSTTAAGPGTLIQDNLPGATTNFSLSPAQQGSYVYFKVRLVSTSDTACGGEPIW